MESPPRGGLSFTSSAMPGEMPSVRCAKRKSEFYITAAPALYSHQQRICGTITGPLTRYSCASHERH